MFQSTLTFPIFLLSSVVDVTKGSTQASLLSMTLPLDHFEINLETVSRTENVSEL